MEHTIMKTDGAIVEWIRPIPLDVHTDHPEPDETKIEELAGDMSHRGWNGPPVVVWREDYAITGTHRIHAWDHAYSDKLPCVHIEDILDAYDIATKLDVDYGDLDLDDIADIIHDYLPLHVAETYGIEIH